MTVRGEAIQIARCELLGCELAQDLSQAFLKSESINIEFGLNWLRHLATTTLANDEVAFLYTAKSNSGDFIVLPLRVNQKSRQAHSLSNFYTSLYSPVVQSSSPLNLLTALFQHLQRSQLISAITLSPLAADEALFDDIQRALQQANWRGVHSWSCFWNWTHTVSDGGYAAYLSARPSILRNTIARKTRKFFNSQNGSIELICDNSSIARGIDQFKWVYDRSWKQAEPFPEFIPGLLKLAADNNYLRLAVAYRNDKAIAAQLWLVHNGTASIFKLAYDENFKHLSVGTILSAFLMEQVIDKDRVRTIDYLSGDDRYKEQWMTSRRERRGIAAYNTSSVRGLAGYLARLAKQLIKNIIP